MYIGEKSRMIGFEPSKIFYQRHGYLLLQSEFDRWSNFLISPLPTVAVNSGKMYEWDLPGRSDKM